MPRKKIPRHAEAGILVSSRRRCCICFGLHRDLEVKKGQIAHLDHDNENNSEENLAFLCLEHHDQYDSSTSQSKNYTLAEVKAYRTELYDAILQPVEIPSPERVSFSTLDRDHFTTHTEQENMSAIVELMTEAGWPQRSLADMARKLTLRTKTVDRLLFLLSEAGVVRIDRQVGTTRKVFSLSSSLENRLLDSFVASLDAEVTFDRRYLRGKQHEVDAFIGTLEATYAVETMSCYGELSTALVAHRISSLNVAKEALGLDDSIGVLVIGINRKTIQTDLDLRTIEDRGVLVRFVEMVE
jgi:hypothetical protein